MNVAVIGRGLIGGSLEKAAIRAGHSAEVFRGRGPTPDLSRFDIVFVAVPPAAVAPVVDAAASSGSLKDGAVVVDIAGVKTAVCESLAKYAGERRWYFVGGHPMAGKERIGYENSSENLFDGASMILTPFDSLDGAVIKSLDGFFRSLGFARVVVTDTRHHDEMIAFTSQLCHLISSAYVREPLALRHAGFSAGSFRDMVRVGAPDPDTWTDLFLMNGGPLVDVLDRYIARLADFRDAIASGDRARLHRSLEEGVAAKAAMEEATR